VRPGRKSAIAILVLLFAILFAESYLRMFGSRLFGDRGRSYVHRPWRIRVAQGVPFRTNGWGLRGEDFTPRALRIVAFGGSATESSDLPEEATWPGRVEHHLNDRFGARLGQVANAGSAGLASPHYVAQVEELARLIGLDVAILYTGLNDTDRLARHGRILRVGRLGDPSYREAMFQAFIAPDPARLAAMGDSILDRSYLVLFLRAFTEKSLVQPLRNRLEDLIPGRRLRDKRARLRASPSLGAVLARARADYGNNLSLMLAAARAAGTTPIFMAAPPIDAEPELVALNAALADFCRERGALFIDLASEAPPPGGWYIYGTHHFTREASDRVGARIAAVIAGLLEGDRAAGRELRRRGRERGLTPARRDDVRWPSG